MPTSGTVTFLPDWGDICEEAYERAGLEPKNGYDLRTARRSLNLLFLEWSNCGLNFWLVDQQTLTLSPGVATYDLPGDTIDVLDGAIRTGSGTSQSDIIISRIGFTTYLQVPNKNNQGRPIQYYVSRNTGSVKVTFYNVPDQAYTFVYYRLRRIQDSGGMENSPDVPVRFIPAMIAGLAYKIACKRTPDPTLRAQLKQEYEEQMSMAIDADAERAPLLIYPRSYM